MSFHNKPNYQIPELIEALKAHRLPHDTPSQLADSFRIGWMACRELAQADTVQEDAARYRWLRINAIGAFRTNDGKGPVSVYHLSKIPAIPGIPEETDAAIDAAMNKGGSA